MFLPNSLQELFEDFIQDRLSLMSELSTDSSLEYKHIKEVKEWANMFADKFNLIRPKDSDLYFYGPLDGKDIDENL